MTGDAECTLTLCADDFGQSPAISLRIVALAQAGRLQATSCLVNGAHWLPQAPRLADAPAALQRGLHLNLTEGAPLSAALARHWPQLPRLPRLIAAAHLGRLPLAALADELAAQLGAFHAATGRLPDHLDGHQHVHHLPGVRNLLLRLLDTLPPTTFVRSTAHVGGPGFAVKRWLIERTGGRALGRRLAQRGAAHNGVLIGCYDFIATDYRALVQRWLAALPAGGALLFCHPGDADGEADPIAAARLREAAYLGSAAFADDLVAAGVRLSV